MERESLLIALGGNAISRENEEGNIHQQFRTTKETMDKVAKLVKGGWRRLIISHGNGPQVGNILLRAELAVDAGVLYPLPLDTCVSDSQGGMGYMIQQVLLNCLREEGIEDVDVATVITQCLVRRDDPAFDNPSKPIGRFMGEEDALSKTRKYGWNVREDAGRGWRRVVPSPEPFRILEEKVIGTLFDKGVVVIAAGGGGIPAVIGEDGLIRGIEAVIDKDLASQVLATALGIHTFMILTSVECVYVNFRKKDQKALRRVTLEEIKRFQKEGQFLPGSMGPKIEAAVRFLSKGGKRVVITTPPGCIEALRGEGGTEIAAS